MKKSLVAVIAILFFMTMFASAAVVTYNTSLTSPPGTYYGSGNPNTGWAVYNNGNIELGLTAFLRYTGALPVVGNTYTAPLGQTAAPGKTGSAWGFAYSANALAGANHDLDDYTYSVKLESIGGGGSVTFNPLLIPDNSYWGVGGETSVQDLPHQTGFQNAEAPSFGFIAVPLGYDWNANETYRITLTALSASGVPTITNSVSIMVNAGSGAPGQVPEPATYGLMAAGLGAIAFLRRKKE